MENSDFEFYKELLLLQSGLSIGPDRIYLLESRLTPLAHELGYDRLDGLTASLKRNPTQNFVKRVVEAMTTNETSFFRDNKPFQLLQQKLIPILLERNSSGKSIRVWSAACSSGQEAYSLAMLFKETPALANWQIEIIGTDYSEPIVNQAKQGIYNQFEIQRGLNIQYMLKYFIQVGSNWQINDTIRKMVSFKVGNLLQPTNGMGQFDLIFCRNVLIYFNSETKEAVLARLANNLKPQSWLVVGGSESLLNVKHSYKSVADMPGYFTNSTGN